MNWILTTRPLRRRTGLLLAMGALALPARAAPVRTVASGGDQRVRLRDAGNALGMRYSIPAARELRLKGGRTFSFETDSRQLRVDGLRVWMNAPTAKIGRHWTVTKTDLDSILVPFVRPADFLRRTRIRVISLDAGHGGKDTGAIGAIGLLEKSVTLNLVQKVRTRLKQAGLTVVLTRDKDRELQLENRCLLARRQGADLFVSLHLNAATSRAATGVETHVLSSAGYPSTAAAVRQSGRKTAQPGHRDGATSLLLAYQVQKAMVTRLGEPDRGVRRSNFAVLRDATFPAVLVECGFLSHATTEKRFQTEAYLDRVAAALTEGILAYVRAVRASQLSAPGS